jgi:hypothetical protein
MEGTQYGAQPPRANPAQKLQWVQDVRDPGKGPALYFQTIYNKVIVIQGEKFPSPDLHMRSTDDNDLSKRGWEHPDRKDYDGPAPSISGNVNVGSNRYASKPGEEPWYCYWNGTMVEGFIYIKDTVNGASTQQFTAEQPTTETSAPSSVNSNLNAAPMTTTLSTSTSPSPQISARAVFLPRSPGSKPSATSIITTPPARFPFVVKIDERRFPTSAFTPFCQKMVVNANGKIIPKLDASGNEIIEVIKETSASGRSASQKKFTNWKQSAAESFPIRGKEQSAQMFRRALGEWDMSADGSTIVKRDAAGNMPTNGCHCQWVSPT